jgi:hypothetical protein
MGPRVGVGVSWRHRGSAWPGQLGQLTGQQATAARGGSGDDGGGVGRHMEADVRIDGPRGG